MWVKGGYIDNPGGVVVGFFLGMTRGDSITGINKDSLDCGFSPHSQYHMAAVNLSIKGTMQYIDDIQKNLTDSQLRMLFGMGTTFAFAVDTTSVLKPITSTIKGHTIRIVEDDVRVYENRKANQYIVAAFEGDSAAAVTETIEIDAFKSNVLGLGRATTPRNSCVGLPLNGIYDLLKSLDDGSTLFLMAGAYPPDDSLAADIVNLAYAKDIAIHSFHYRGGCLNDYTRLRTSFRTRSVYESFAAATGGTSFGKAIPQGLPAFGRLGQRSEQDRHENQTVAISEISEPAVAATELAALQAAIQNKGEGGQILEIAEALTWWYTKRTYTFPVDSSITELKLALMSKTARISVTNPNGTILDLDSYQSQLNQRLNLFSSNPGITATDLENGSFVTISKPASGTWTTTIEGTGDFKLSVYGTSTLHLHSFDFSRNAGRDGHKGFFPLESPPKAREEVAMIAEIRGPFKSATFEFRDAKGYWISYPGLKQGTNAPGEAPKNSFFGMGRVYPGTQYVYVTGKNEQGEWWQRVGRKAIQLI
jgi:hypothetical protein